VISAQSNENCWTSSRKYEKTTKNDTFDPNIWPLGEKIKIPPHYVFAYGHSTHFYVISAQSNENCWTSSRKYEKNTKNDKFFPRCDLDLDRVTLRPMPGYSCIQGQYTLQVLWNSDNGKVVKNPGRTDVYCCIWLVDRWI
jgi:hypothetical protein